MQDDFITVDLHISEIEVGDLLTGGEQIEFIGNKMIVFTTLDGREQLCRRGSSFGIRRPKPLPTGVEHGTVGGGFKYLDSSGDPIEYWPTVGRNQRGRTLSVQQAEASVAVHVTADVLEHMLATLKAEQA